ncbi:plasmid mobilization relaxosome protein MobC [Puia sp. P3]|uniref:plasmid mobilization protein n=1 Tax=Puia sp. P3 TaxID=3423952 RepID=UPI003D66F4C4
MTSRRKSRPKILTHVLTTKVDDPTYRKLRSLLDQNPQNDMSRLVRAIITKQPVRVFTRDLTLDNVMEELSRLRTEIKHIGVNINQITRKFNTYPEPQRKAFYAKMVFQRISGYRTQD